jgi:glycosyltransferase involved in cell wall biosynthesis
MVILHYIASPFWGGGEQYICDLSINIKHRYGVDHVFVCQPNTPTEVIERWQQIGRVYCLRPQTKNGKFSWITAFKLVKIIREEQVDIVHVHELKDFFICTYAKLFSKRPIRLVATRHLIAPAKNKILWRLIYRQIDHIIFVSQCAKNAFLKHYKVRNSVRNSQIIPNSIYIPETFSKQIDLRIEYNIPTYLPLILFHGRICKEKGIIQLLEVLSTTFKKNYAIILAGHIDDDIRSRLELLVHNSPMAGYIYPIGFQRNITNIIAQCQVGILPSIVPEAASLSLLEYMAMGSAIIASNNGSQPEYAENGEEALLLPPGDWKEWEKSINLLINNRELAEQIGKQARERFAQDFTYDIFLERIYHVYTNR